MPLLRGPDGERTPLGAIVDPVRDFLRTETSGGLLLLIATVAALIWANLPGDSYEQLWSTRFTMGSGPLAISEDLRHWINSGPMTIFFFMIGLEIKRELVTGELHEPRTAALPAIAAAGGVLLPAAIFLAVVGGGAQGEGWGIPIATDIAFAIGVVAVLGSRVSPGSRLFLLTLAIVDDVIAITVIAVVYSHSVSVAWLGLAAAALIAMPVLRALGISSFWPYLLVGALAWYAAELSGVHATLVGVVAGLITPARPWRGVPVLERWEHGLHPLSAYLVVPLFALANAGVVLDASSLTAAVQGRIAWGVALGLLLGKTIGIVAATLLALRLRLGSLPGGMALRHLLGVAALAGIGFTVSLFIADLAYHQQGQIEQAKIGILAGSLASGLLGAALMSRAERRGRSG